MGQSRNHNAVWRTAPAKQDLLHSMQHIIFNNIFYISFLVVFDVQMLLHLTQPLKNIYWLIEGISPNLWRNPGLRGGVFTTKRLFLMLSIIEGKYLPVGWLVEFSSQEFIIFNIKDICMLHSQILVPCMFRSVSLRLEDNDTLKGHSNNFA